MNNMFQIGNITGGIGNLTNSNINLPFLTEQQLLAGQSGYISPATDMVSIELKKKALQEQQKKLQEANKKNAIMASIMAIPQEPIKPFDITEMDKIRQSISKKSLGASQMRIPVMGV